MKGLSQKYIRDSPFFQRLDVERQATANLRRLIRVQP